VLAVVAIALTSVVSVGLAAIVWVPLILALGIALLMVWSARRRRQKMQNRGPDEVRDPTRGEPPWPTEGIIDDRLPEH
jgi:Flp pilus assembly protein TadB